MAPQAEAQTNAIALPKEMRIGIIHQELAEYSRLRYQAELRHRVATRIRDEQMKQAVAADLVRIEGALDELSEALRQETDATKEA